MPNIYCPISKRETVPILIIMYYGYYFILLHSKAPPAAAYDQIDNILILYTLYSLLNSGKDFIPNICLNRLD
jgi:hypothetical protein